MSTISRLLERAIGQWEGRSRDFVLAAGLMRPDDPALLAAWMAVQAAADCIDDFLAAEALVPKGDAA